MRVQQTNQQRCVEPIKSPYCYANYETDIDGFSYLSHCRRTFTNGRFIVEFQLIDDKVIFFDTFYQAQCKMLHFKTFRQRRILAAYILDRATSVIVLTTSQAYAGTMIHVLTPDFKTQKLRVDCETTLQGFTGVDEQQAHRIEQTLDKNGKGETRYIFNVTIAPVIHFFSYDAITNRYETLGSTEVIGQLAASHYHNNYFTVVLKRTYPDLFIVFRYELATHAKTIIEAPSLDARGRYNQDGIVFDDSTGDVLVPIVDNSNEAFEYNMYRLNTSGKTGDWTNIEVAPFSTLLAYCYHREMKPKTINIDEALDLYHLDKHGVLTIHSKRNLYAKSWSSFRWGVHAPDCLAHLALRACPFKSRLKLPSNITVSWVLP